MYRKHYFSIHESFVTTRKHTKTIVPIHYSKQSKKRQYKLQFKINPSGWIAKVGL